MTMIRPFALALLFAVPSAAQTQASLTGHYTGIVACDRTEAGQPGAFQLQLDIRVLQEDDRLHIATWTEGSEVLKRRNASLYTGRAVSADGRVSGYAIACRPDFEYSEFVRILPALANEDGLTFTADTIFATEALPGREGDLITESCRWVMARQDAEPPEMEQCAVE